MARSVRIPTEPVLGRMTDDLTGFLVDFFGSAEPNTLKKPTVATLPGRLICHSEERLFATKNLGRSKQDSSLEKALAQNDSLSYTASCHGWFLIVKITSTTLRSFLPSLLFDQRLCKIIVDRSPFL